VIPATQNERFPETAIDAASGLTLCVFQLGLVRMHDQHRRRALVENSVADAAEQDRGRSATSPRSHHDQVVPALVRSPDDLVRRPADTNERRRRDLVGHSCGRLVDKLLGIEFDLVICDLQMPRLSGREFYGWLARARPDLASRVVFSSGDLLSPEFAAFLSEAGRPRAALCGIELRSPAPFSFGGFDDFNQGYRSLLAEWKILVGDENPIPRTNVAPVAGAPLVPSLFAFSYTVAGTTAAPTFVVAGAGELRERAQGPEGIVRAGETTPDAMREKARFVMGIMQERMNRMFDDAGRGWRGDEPSSTTTWSPAVDIYETENEIMVQAELPGVDRKDIVLNLEKNVLTLKGERHFEKETRQENYHRIERAYGGFSRSFSIPAIVDEEKIRADYKDGILKIALPKKEQVKPKQIQISEMK